MTYRATWSGFVYVAFVIDAFFPPDRRWRGPPSLRTNLELDDLEQGLCARPDTRELVVPSDRGARCLSIPWTERLREAGEDVIAYMAFPQGYSRRIHSPNVLERVHRELRAAV